MRPRPGEAPSARRARVLAHRDDQTFAAYLGELHPDVEAIFRAIAERVTAEPEKISAGCGAALFALVWGDDKTGSARNLIGGSELLPQALAHRLGDRVLTGAAGEEVVPHADGVRVPVRSPGRVHGDLGRLRDRRHAVLRDAPDCQASPARHRGGPRRDPVRPVRLRSLPHRGDGPMPWDHIYAVAVVDKSFNMLFNHANPLRTPAKREPGGSLMVYAGGDRGRRLLPLSNDEIRALFLRDLHDVLPATRGIVREVLDPALGARDPLRAARARPDPGGAHPAASAGSSWPGTTWNSRRWRRPPPRVSRPRTRSAGGRRDDESQCPPFGFG